MEKSMQKADIEPEEEIEALTEEEIEALTEEEIEALTEEEIEALTEEEIEALVKAAIDRNGVILQQIQIPKNNEHRIPSIKKSIELEISRIEGFIESLENDISYKGSLELLLLWGGIGSFLSYQLGLKMLLIMVAGLVWYLYDIGSKRNKAVEILPTYKHKISLLNYERDLLEIFSNSKGEYNDEEIKIIEAEFEVIVKLSNLETAWMPDSEKEKEISQLREEQYKLRCSRKQ